MSDKHDGNMVEIPREELRALRIAKAEAERLRCEQDVNSALDRIQSARVGLRASLLVAGVKRDHAHGIVDQVEAMIQFRLQEYDATKRLLASQDAIMAILREQG